jgi:predicted dithiol-disulfide oxidoreductase (DUF899 family)
MSTTPPIVSREAWLAARTSLLAQEKQLTRQRDQLAAARRALPWVRVDEPYAFERVAGPASLAELFDGKRQLIVYHFMFGPDDQAGCKSCSFWADGFAGIVPHLAHRDTTLIAVSRAPLAKLTAYARRLGWQFTWASSFGSSFNRDFGVSFSDADRATGHVTYNYATQPARGSELPGISVFIRGAAGEVFHTYSCFARGLDMVNPAYQLLDLTPLGRDEDALPAPMAWLRRRDEYGA